MSFFLRPFFLSGLLMLPLFAIAETSFEFGGRNTLQYQGARYPDDSLIKQLVGSASHDLNGEIRLVTKAKRNAWDFKADYQFIVLYGDTIEYTRLLPPEYENLFGRLPNDDRRWFNLTDEIEDKDKLAVLQRLDRLSVGYTGAKTSLRFGRQAISWGNGLVFSPMDIVNPFDPTQVDTEYKAGDDMLNGQYLFDNGNDVQATYVVRRNPVTGDVESDQATLAVKYHGLVGSAEYDLLVAEHYGDALVGLGGNVELGGAVWRSDAVFSWTEEDDVVSQFVTNLSYSWMWGGKNVNGILEYYFNGFGQSDGCYSASCLSDNPELVERIARRQLFTLGRHYLAASAMIEVTPLFIFTPNIFWNVGDSSALLQLNTQNDLAENLTLIGSLGVPIGASGTEYGGIETDVPGVYLSSELSVFAQLRWYF
jgi:hypothetical protein